MGESEPLAAGPAPPKATSLIAVEGPSAHSFDAPEAAMESSPEIEEKAAVGRRFSLFRF